MKEKECHKIEEHTERVAAAKRNVPNGDKLQKTCDLFRVLGEPSRMKIVCALKAGELCVYHIVAACGGNQSAVSHQLRILKDNGVVRARREGQNILYSIADHHVYEILSVGEEHADCEILEE